MSVQGIQKQEHAETEMSCQQRDQHQFRVSHADEGQATVMSKDESASQDENGGDGSGEEIEDPDDIKVGSWSPIQATRVGTADHSTKERRRTMSAPAHHS